MTENQKNIIDRFDELNKPLEEHCAKLQKIMEERPTQVAQDFLNYYMTELLQWKDLKLMILKEFAE